MIIIIDDAAGMTKYIWDYLDMIVIGGKMETVEANTRAANKGVSTMTQFKEGDEVLVKAKFLCGREDWYYDNSKRKMYYDKAVLTFDYEIDGYFAPCVKDLIPASALDVNKQLLAENNRLREENYDLTLTFLLSKEKAADEIKRLREALAFYAEWGIDAPAVDAIIEEDCGDKARAALNIVLGEEE